MTRRNYVLATALIAVAVLAGCADFGWIDTRYQPNVGTKDSGIARLQRISTASGWVDYFKAQLEARQVREQMPFDFGAVLFSGVPEVATLSDVDQQAAPPAPAFAAEDGASANVGGGERAAGPDDFTSTNVQVVGVDEADVVKSDGEYFYLLSNGELRVIQAYPSSSLEEVGRLLVRSDVYGQELYLYNNTVVLIQQAYGDEYFYSDTILEEDFIGVADVVDGDGGIARGAPGEDEPADADVAIATTIAPRVYRERVIVTSVDVSDPATPTVTSSWEFDGSTVTSRMIDGILHLILYEYPSLPYDMRPEDVTIDSITEYIPTYSRKDGAGEERDSGTLIKWSDFYRPVDPDGFGITAVITVDISNDASDFSSVAVIADSGSVYASTTALYLTDPEFDYFFDYREQTDIHKFNLSAAGADYVSSAAVDGRLLNQFSMGEHNGYLRVATTTGEPWAWDEATSKNHVVVLGERDGDFFEMGSVRDLAPGERIYAARFVGDRGFLVTFKQVDPLFTLDLANPEAPRVVGELKIPGFSEYIHLLDKDHLLTIGRAATLDGRAMGMQLSIFDVTNFADPQLKFVEEIGTQGTYSEAEHNHKAMTFYEPEGLLALPVTVYESLPGREWGEYSFNGLQVYAISAESGISLRGQMPVSPTDEPYQTYWGWTRGHFIGDMVYAVTELGVHAATIVDPGSIVEHLEIADAPQYGGGIYVDDVFFDVVDEDGATLVTEPVTPIR